MAVNSHERRLLNRALKEAGINSPALSRGDTPVDQKHKEPKRSQVSNLLGAASKRIFSGLVATATLLGLGVYSFRPRISIDPYVSSDSEDPFAQQFVVQNNGIYSLKDARGVCDIQDVATATNSGVSGISIAGKQDMDHLDILEPDAKMNVICRFNQLIQFQGSPPFTKLKIGIMAMYKLPLGFRQCREVNFSGSRTSTGTFIWTYQGAATCKWLDLAPILN